MTARNNVGVSADALLSALAKRERREAYQLIGEHQVASPKELALLIGKPLPNISYHVKILRDLGLIELVRTTPRRGAVEHHYRQAKKTKPAAQRVLEAVGA